MKIRYVSSDDIVSKNAEELFTDREEPRKAFWDIYKAMGHAYFDNCGVYSQCKDCIEEIGHFILENSK